MVTDFLFDYTLHLADSSLIMGHRLSEWTGHGPMLEQDIAISNIALDLIGQSRNFYQYAATMRENTTEDTLAYLRDSRDFKNLLLVELPNGDWAKTILKLFFFNTYQFYFYEQLKNCADAQLAAIAEKSLKETTYHLRWSSEWVIRLGDGTEESNKRLRTALEDVWPYTGEMFQPAAYETEFERVYTSITNNGLQEDWYKKVEDIFIKSFLLYPDEKKVWMHTGGKNGIHTEHLGYLLAEMQYLQRAYPGCEW